MQNKVLATAFSRLKFRDHWALWLGGISVLLAVYIYTSVPSNNTIYHPNIEETVDYLALLSQYHNPIPDGLLLLAMLFTVLIIGMVVLRPRKRTFLALALVIVADVGVAYACARTVFRDQTT